MELKEYRSHKCVVCSHSGVGDGLILETRIRVLPETDLPDIRNCDISEYKEHRIEGGTLFDPKRRPNAAWSTSPDSPPGGWGGVCTGCLVNNRTVRKLFAYLPFQKD
jgi:hypothetical protein